MTKRLKSLDTIITLCYLENIRNRVVPPFWPRQKSGKGGPTPRSEGRNRLINKIVGKVGGGQGNATRCMAGR